MDITHLQSLKQMNHRRLCALELKQALLGFDAPPHILIEIEELRKVIIDLDNHINTLHGQASSKPVQVVPSDNDLVSDMVLAEISVKGDYTNWSPEKLSIAIQAFAAILDIPANQVKIFQIKRGSIVFTLGLPSNAANKLHQLYKANDQLLLDMGVEVVSVREVNREVNSFLIEMKNEIDELKRRLEIKEQQFVQEHELVDELLAVNQELDTELQALRKFRQRIQEIVSNEDNIPNPKSGTKMNAIIKLIRGLI